MQTGRNINIVNKKSQQCKLFELLIIALVIFPVCLYTGLSASENLLLLFNEIVKVNSGIESIDADIIQYIDTPEHSREVFKGRYFADNKGRFRINYTAPSRQIVLNDGNTLYWYFPDQNILYTFGNKNSNTNDLKVNPLQEFQNKNFDKQFQITYKGKHFYGFFNTAHEFIIKDIKNELNFNIRINSKNNALLSKIVTNSVGQEIIKEIYENHKNIKNVLFPARIDIYARTGKGVTRNTTEYTNVRLNFSLSENIFHIKFPENVKKKYMQ